MTRAPSQRPADGFKPGDIVECVDARGAPELIKGALYTITGLERAFNALGVKIEGVEPLPETVRGRRQYYSSFRADRFRHVYRPDPKLIKLLTSTPVFIDERESEVVF